MQNHLHITPNTRVSASNKAKIVSLISYVLEICYCKKCATYWELNRSKSSSCHPKGSLCNIRICGDARYAFHASFQQVSCVAWCDTKCKQYNNCNPSTLFDCVWHWKKPHSTQNIDPWHSELWELNWNGKPPFLKLNGTKQFFTESKLDMVQNLSRKQFFFFISALFILKRGLSLYES